MCFREVNRRKTPFVLNLLNDEDQLYLLKQISDVQKRAPSAVVDISDELSAFQLDAACLFVARERDFERDFERLKIYKNQFKAALSEWWKGEPDCLDAEPETTPLPDDEADFD